MNRTLKCLAIAFACCCAGESANAQSVFPALRILSVSATEPNGDFEVTFDATACLGRTPASRAQVLASLSVNHALMFSTIMAAFLANLPVHVQTSDDAHCHIRSFEVRR
jgi:hypothetical protein